jgi:hypothetical protein
MKRRYRAVGVAERALRRQCETVPSMLTSVCVREYAGHVRAPLLLRCGFADGSCTDWCPVHRTDVSAVQMAIVWLGRDYTLPENGVRLHVMQADADEVPMVPPQRPSPERERAGVGAAMLAAMPMARLGATGASRLSAAGVDSCMYCLEELRDGDVVLAFPCPGTHLAHALCSAQWLATAHTCPACRFELPRDLTPRTLGGLVQHARSELSRITANEPQPQGLQRPGVQFENCESAELDELRSLLSSGAPSQRERALSGVP